MAAAAAGKTAEADPPKPPRDVAWLGKGWNPNNPTVPSVLPFITIDVAKRVIIDTNSDSKLHIDKKVLEDSFSLTAGVKDVLPPASVMASVTYKHTNTHTRVNGAAAVALSSATFKLLTTDAKPMGTYDAKITAQGVIDDYGTHVVLAAATGGVALVYSDETKEVKDFSFTVGAGPSGGNPSIAVGRTRTATTTVVQAQCFGGVGAVDSADKLSEWSKSVTPEKANVFVVDAKPIYEFIPAGKLHDDVKRLVDKIIADIEAERKKREQQNANIVAGFTSLCQQLKSHVPKFVEYDFQYPNGDIVRYVIDTYKLFAIPDVWEISSATGEFHRVVHNESATKCLAELQKIAKANRLTPVVYF